MDIVLFADALTILVIGLLIISVMAPSRSRRVHGRQMPNQASVAETASSCNSPGSKVGP